MIYKSFAEIKAKVERDLDIEVEEFIQPQEFIEYVNDGIKDAESHIHKLGLEDEYFLSKAQLALVTAQEDYTLPANIYADKIRAIVYRNGATIYTIKRLRGPEKFEVIERINQYNTVTDYYNYLLRNDSAANGVKLQLVPPSRETLPVGVTIWYIRSANRWITDDTQFCDIPEVGMNYLYDFIKYKVLFKEGHPSSGEMKSDMEKSQQVMIQTLEQMVPDDETEVYKDLSFYQDMS